MICPNCGTPDPGPGPFCMACGYRLPAPTTAAPTPLVPEEQSGMPQTVAPASPLTPEAQAAADRLAAHRIGQMESAGTVPVNIWGPFAGYGTRGRHVSWLINDQGERADALRDVVASRFERREIPRATVEPVTLVRKGVLVDTRPYFLIRRNLTTAGLYIARFGQDLYVSQVTYFKGPISTLRVLLLAAALLFALIYPLVYKNAFGQVGVSLFGGVGGDLLGLTFLTCCLGPIYLLVWLALGILELFTLYKWLTDKDPLAALRVPPNEFDIDDTSALEKAVEQTVREALDAVGIEQRLMPQATEQSFRRRLI